MREITTIMFDLSEVLISGLVGFEEELAAMVGVPAESLLTAFRIRDVHRVCRGEMTEDEYLGGVLGSEGWDVSLEDLKRVIRGNFHREEDGMIALAEDLSSRVTQWFAPDIGLVKWRVERPGRSAVEWQLLSRERGR